MSPSPGIEVLEASAEVTDPLKEWYRPLDALDNVRLHPLLEASELMSGRRQTQDLRPLLCEKDLRQYELEASASKMITDHLYFVHHEESNVLKEPRVCEQKMGKFLVDQ